MKALIRILEPILWLALLSATIKVHAFYDPNSGRWLNRDPIGESGGIPLYAPVGNQPANRIDYLGLRDPDDPGQGIGRCCYCESATVTFNPGGSAISLGWLPDNSGASRYGVNISVKWNVRGDPRLCSYYQNERGSGLFRWRLPDNSGFEQVSGDDHTVSQQYTDLLGWVFRSPTHDGTWSLLFNIKIELKCVSSPGYGDVTKQINHLELLDVTLPVQPSPTPK